MWTSVVTSAPAKHQSIQLMRNANRHRGASRDRRRDAKSEERESRFWLFRLILMVGQVCRDAGHHSIRIVGFKYEHL